MADDFLQSLPAERAGWQDRLTRITGMAGFDEVAAHVCEAVRDLAADTTMEDAAYVAQAEAIVHQDLQLSVLYLSLDELPTGERSTIATAGAARVADAVMWRCPRPDCTVPPELGDLDGPYESEMCTAHATMRRVPGI